jgi:type II secretion system protein N
VLRRRIAPIVGYVLYGLAAFVIFVYVLFPYGALRRWASDRVSRGDVRLSIARMGPTLLPGLALRQVRLTQQSGQTSNELLYLDTVRVRPQLWPLVTGRLDARFTGTLYDGRVEGRIREAKAQGKTMWRSQARLTAVDIAKHALLQQNTYVAVTGRLEGTATATMRADGELQRGEGDFRLQPAVFAPQQAARLILKRDVVCDTMTAKVTLAPRQWQVQNLTCEGDDVLLDVRGTVRPQQSAANSALNLRFRLRSATTLKQELALLGTLVRRSPDRRGELTFGLRGTFQRPRLVR